MTHVDGRGQANMVDVGDKALTRRRAVAEAVIRLDAETCDLLFTGQLSKGEALAVARIAGIQAAKEPSRLIPRCHSLALSHAGVASRRSSFANAQAAAITLSPEEFDQIDRHFAAFTLDRTEGYDLKTRLRQKLRRVKGRMNRALGR